MESFLPFWLLATDYLSFFDLNDQLLKQALLAIELRKLR